MVLKRIDPVSCAKVYGLICVIVGFIVGLFIAGAVWLTSSIFGPSMGSEVPMPGMSMFFGGGAIVSFPIFYGVFGFIMGFLSAVVYNWIAGMIGGIELDFE